MNKNKIDQFADREADKYENPIPSREFIMDFLAEVGQPLKYKHIAERLELTEGPDVVALKRRLRAMERDGQLIQNRRGGYGLVGKMDLVCGSVSAHPDGFGFLIPDEGGDDLFLSATQMRSVFHRDRIVANVVGVDRRGRREGAVVEVLQRNTNEVVGKYIQRSGVGFVEPDHKRVIHDVMVPPGKEGQAKHGQIVVVKILEQPTKKHPPVGEVIELLGENMAPGMEIDIAIRAHELPHEWPAAALREVEKINPLVSDADSKGRTDLRHLPLVTIDGADARDFDDAVYCEPQGRNWRLVVAIADVAHYVKIGSALDAHALERGNSVYFPERVIPMLPEVLSNGLCSLNPHVDRLSMVCDMTITATGSIKEYVFYNAVFQSHARLIYDDVAALIEGDVPLREQHARLVPHLENLFELYKILSQKRHKRGAIEFETTETIIQFDENKKIENIIPLFRNDAHKMIEECMISANICAAHFLSDNEMPTLYRVHQPPKTDKLLDLRAFLSGLGLDLAGGPNPKPKHYCQLIESARDRHDWHLIQTVMLRSLNQAVYSPENHGHFGLALEHYAHFTSPIRRYPDLLVHRAIKHVLLNKTPKNFEYNMPAMVVMGEKCSSTERRADEATRDVVDWLKCEFMMDKVGESYVGIITGVTSFGLFVELENIYVEGLVHVTALNNDYYHFDPVKHCLVGDRTRQQFRLGDQIEVRVLRVDLDEKQIDFGLEQELTSSSNSKTSAKTKASSRKEKSGGKSQKKDATSTIGKKSSSSKKKRSKKSKTKEKSNTVVSNDKASSKSEGTKGRKVKSKKKAGR